MALALGISDGSSRIIVQADRRVIAVLIQQEERSEDAYGRISQTPFGY